MNFTTYKRLFEVRLLHGYYLDNRLSDALTDEPGRFYGLSLEQQSALLNNEYNIMADLEVVPTKATVELMKRQRMRWKATGSMFFAGLEVRSLSANRMAPVFPLPDGASFTFLLKQRNPFWYNMTNHAMRYPLPGKYLFTNRREAGDGKLGPSLSRPAPVFDGLRSLEMGELATVGVDLKYALKGSPSAADFSAAIVDRHFASTADRLAISKVFKYRFDPLSQPVSTAVFNLRTLAGLLVKQVSLPQTGASVSNEELLDFRYMDLQPGETTAQRIADGRYQLEFIINGSQFGPVQNILFLDEIPSDDSVVGVVEMVYDASQTDEFRLLEPDGAVRSVKLAGTPNRWRNEAVFDIRFMSRPTYWAYNLPAPNGQNGGDVELFNSADRLVTINPRHLTRSLQKVGYLTGNLPNPTNLQLDFDAAGDRFLSEMHISLP